MDGEPRCEREGGKGSEKTKRHVMMFEVKQEVIGARWRVGELVVAGAK